MRLLRRRQQPRGGHTLIAELHFRLPAILADVSPASHAEIANQHSGDIAGILAGAAAICAAIVWPVLIGFILLLFRKPAAELLAAAVGVAEGATRFKIWQIEFDRDVQQQVAQSQSAALVAPVLSAPGSDTRAPLDAARPAANASREVTTEAAATIPGSEIEAAAGVRSLLDAAPSSTLRKSAEEAIKARMLVFAQEYESTRSSMRAGDDRTRALNGIVAKMRTLALAADLFVTEFMNAPNAPGRHLAAICILQMKPDMQTVPWLVERMAQEQPFVFFHAAVALLNAVRHYGQSERARLGSAIEAALRQVQSFGEAADLNTLRVLTLAQSELTTAS